MSIYSDIILDNYQSPKNFKVVPNHNRSVEVANSLCGDKLVFSAVIHNNKIENIGFQGEGCAISIASASILTEHVKNKKVEEVLNLTSQDVEGFLGITLTPNRLKCALLAWEGVRKIVNEV